MKNITRALAFIALTFAFNAVQSQQDFTIKGKMKKLKDGTVINLMYRQNGILTTDSAVVKDGSFSFSGSVNEPIKARMIVKPENNSGLHTKAAVSGNAAPGNMAQAKLLPGSDAKGIVPKGAMVRPDFIELYLEKSTITIKGADSLKTAKVVGGGPNQKDFNEYNKAVMPLYAKMERLTQGRQFPLQDKDDNRSTQKLEEIHNQTQTMAREFIAKHPGSYVSLGLLQSMSVVIVPETFEPLYGMLSAELKQTETGKTLASKLAASKLLAVGKPAKEIVQNNTEDVPVKLSSLKGKYVLIDFWASWCGPCRAENPYVAKAYQQFKDKGFEIYAVSLDHKKDLWEEAIKKDGLPWIHVSDLKGWKNDAAVDYSVSAVPQNYLLDPNGIIIAKNLRGEDLAKKLSEIIKN